MKQVIVAAVSGGPDSMFLLHELARRKEVRIVVGHVNHGARRGESDKDQEMVEDMAKHLHLGKVIYKPIAPRRSRKGPEAGEKGCFPPGFENRARNVRRAFFKRLSRKFGAAKVALAHTADDQVETILMRVFEGAGIGGLKGIPRGDGGEIVHPILYVWKEDILEYLKRRKIPYRTDRSNVDTRFERNWVRHVLLPVLVERYGKSVKLRIHTLGERFRELDDYLEGESQRWIRKNIGDTGGGIRFRRTSYSGLPTVLRVKILQRACFDRLGLAPNERLLAAMDRTVLEGGPSARLNVGKGWKLVLRYDEATFLHEHAAAKDGGFELVSEAKRGIGPARAKRLAAKGDAEVFDAVSLRMPLDVRPLRAGDRVRPFGMAAEKKVKEILIDRKVPRDDRWGRPVVCDAEGEILWIPGILRSAHAPVTSATRRAVILRIRSRK
jgi:tRNA(Ile)-lysidine synthetase-like protein